MSLVCKFFCIFVAENKSYRDEKSDDDVRGLSDMDGSRCR